MLSFCKKSLLYRGFCRPRLFAGRAVYFWGWANGSLAPDKLFGNRFRLKSRYFYLKKQV